MHDWTLKLRNLYQILLLTLTEYEAIYKLLFTWSHLKISMGEKKLINQVELAYILKISNK